MTNKFLAIKIVDNIAKMSGYNEDLLTTSGFFLIFLLVASRIFCAAAL